MKHLFPPPLRILMLLAAFFSLEMNASSVDTGTAQKTAENFFNSRLTRSSDNGLTLIYKGGEKTTRAAAQTDSAAQFYVFEKNNDDAFVIISGDDEFPPIVGYSLSEKFQPASIPEALAAYLRDYSVLVDAVREGKTAASATTRAEGEAVLPLLKTKWGQGEPFNNLCVNKDETEKYVTGCVATAMAQVMKYHNFPPKGRGVTAESNIPSVDLSKSEYRWDDMLDDYSGDYTGEQADAVARLMRDCGAAVNMMYSSESSGAYDYDVEKALMVHYNYSPDIHYYLRENYSTDKWAEIIRSNLRKGRPMIYSGNSIRYGHTFVCDGIDREGYLHINWGWNGWCDGYFDMNILNSNGGGWDKDDAFYRNQNVVADIHPGDPEADYSSEFKPLTVWNIDPNYDLGTGRLTESLSYTVMKKDNLTERYMDLTVGLYDENKNLVDTVGYVSIPVYAFSFGRYYTYSDRDLYKYKSDFSSTLNDGNYYLSYTEDYFDCSGERYIPVVMRDGALFKYPAAENRGIEVLSLEQDRIIYQNTGFQELQMTFKNNTGKILNHVKFSCYFIPENEAKDDIELSAYQDYAIESSLFAYEGAGITWPISVPTDKLKVGRYRVYLVKSDIPVSHAKPLYIEIEELPKDRPFFFTEKLKTWEGPYNNGDGYYNLFVETSYHKTEYNGRALKTQMEVWAIREGAYENEEFRLLEPKEVIINHSGEIELEGWATFLWKIPGDYRLYIKYKDETGHMVRLSDPNNDASFSIEEIKPEDPYVVMSSPAVINGGEDVRAGSYFPVTFRVMSPTGIDFSAETSYIRILEDMCSATQSVVWSYEGFSFDKDHLEPGEETEVEIKAYVINNDDYYDRSFIFMPKLESIIDGNRKNVEFLAREYAESFRFKVIKPLGEVMMTSPMVINGDRDVVAGNSFEATFRIISEDGVSLDASKSRAFIMSPDGTITLADRLRSLQIESEQLSPGEETEVRIRFDLDKEMPYYGTYQIIVSLIDTEGQNVNFFYGEFGRSRYFNIIEKEKRGAVVASPPVVNNGNEVEAGSRFGISLRIKSETGVTFNPDICNAYIRPAEGDFGNAVLDISRAEFGKLTLAPDEETDVLLTFEVERYLGYFGYGKYKFFLSLYDDSGNYIPVDWGGYEEYSCFDIERPAPLVKLVSPMEINGGERPRPGEEFEIKFSMMSEDRMIIDRERTYARAWFTPDYYAYIPHDDMEFSNTDLYPGDIVEVVTRWYIPDVEDHYNREFNIILTIAEEGNVKQSQMDATNYDSSTYFTTAEMSGIKEVDGEGGFSVSVAGNSISVSGIRPSSPVSLYSTEGRMIISENAVSSKHRLETDVPSGVYILRAAGSDGRLHAVKIVL